MKKEILEKIKSGQVSMHTHLYFALRVAAFIFCMIVAVVISTLLFNIISYQIRLLGDIDLFDFGLRGALFFFAMFPWALLAIDIVAIAIALHLLRHFRVGYNNPGIVLLAVLFGLTVGMGLALDRATGFNDIMVMQAQGKHLGPLNPLYEKRPYPQSGGGLVCRCEVVSVSDDSIVVLDTVASTTFRIVLPQEFATSSLTENQIIFIAGDRDDDVIRVFGIKDKMPHPPRGY